jgi:uncharacterized membrane protein YfcA
VTIPTQIVAAMLGLGLAAGVLSGMFGIGGGLVIVPFLVMVFGLSQKTATGTSLFALLMPVGLLGVLEYRRRQEIRIDYGLLIALGLFAGAYFGAKLTEFVTDRAMKRIYAVFLLGVAAYYLVTTSDRFRAPAPVAPAEAGKRQVH